MMIITMLINLVLWLAMIAALAYLYYLLCKYLRLKLNTKEKTGNAVLVAGLEAKFTKSDSGELLLNTAFVKTLSIKDNAVLAESISGDTYILKQCETLEEAKTYLAAYAK